MIFRVVFRCSNLRKFNFQGRKVKTFVGEQKMVREFFQIIPEGFVTCLDYNTDTADGTEIVLTN